jgi:ABC-type sugar transport system substrate-binding protein
MLTGHRVGLWAIALLLVGTAVVAVATSSASGHRKPTGSAASADVKRIKLPKKTIGIMGPVDAAEVIKLVNDAAEKAAKTLGWKTIRVDPGGDPAKMAAGMTSLVNAHVNAIVLTTMEPATIASGLRSAARAKIPVIDTHTKTQSSKYFAGEYFLPPTKEFNLLLARMKKGLPRGSKIATINLPQFLNAKIAGNQIKSAATAQGWRIVASHDADLQNLVPDVQKATGDILRANPDLKAVWGCCDFAPAGAVPAIRLARKNVKVYALHGVPSTIPFAKAGSAVVEMASYQQGAIAAIDLLAAHFARGAKIPKHLPKGMAYQMKIVDKSNAGKGFPYPTNKLLAPFKKKWAKLYIKAG